MYFQLLLKCIQQFEKKKNSSISFSRYYINVKTDIDIEWKELCVQVNIINVVFIMNHFTIYYIPNLELFYICKCLQAKKWNALKMKDIIWKSGIVDISALKSIPFAEFSMINSKRYVCVCVCVYFNHFISQVFSTYVLGNLNCSLLAFCFIWDRVGSIHLFSLKLIHKTRWLVLFISFTMIHLFLLCK